MLDSSSVMSRGVPKVVSVVNIDSRPCGSCKTQGTRSGASARASSRAVDATTPRLANETGAPARCESGQVAGKREIGADTTLRLDRTAGPSLVWR